MSHNPVIIQYFDYLRIYLNGSKYASIYPHRKLANKTPYIKTRPYEELVTIQDYSGEEKRIIRLVPNFVWLMMCNYNVSKNTAILLFVFPNRNRPKYTKNTKVIFTYEHNIYSGVIESLRDEPNEWIERIRHDKHIDYYYNIRLENGTIKKDINEINIIFYDDNLI